MESKGWRMFAEKETENAKRPQTEDFTEQLAAQIGIPYPSKLGGIAFSDPNESHCGYVRWLGMDRVDPRGGKWRLPKKELTKGGMEAQEIMLTGSQLTVSMAYSLVNWET